MATRDVRLPVPTFNDFLDLDPDEGEVDQVLACLDYLKDHPESYRVPFAPYLEYPPTWVYKCGRFLIEYSFDETHLDIVGILLEEDYQA